MEHIHNIRTVTLDGHSLTLAQLVAVARFDAVVVLSETAKQALARSRALASEPASLTRASRCAA